MSALILLAGVVVGWLLAVFTPRLVVSAEAWSPRKPLAAPVTVTEA